MKKFAEHRAIMVKEETQWIHALNEFLSFIRKEAPQQVEGFSRFIRSLEQMCSDSSVPVQTKYREARRLESIFGGMGSINDYPWSPDAEKSKESLYNSVQDILRLYWKEMGNQTHDPGQFLPIPIGASVKLIEGKTLYINRDESTVTVTGKKEEKVWTVKSQLKPDISGMPTYLLKSDNTYQVARQEAIDAPPLEKPFLRSYWVIPGKLLAGEYPGSPNKKAVKQKVDALLVCGIEHIVNLMEPDELDRNGMSFNPYLPVYEKLAKKQKRDVSSARYAIRDLDIPAVETMKQILDDVDAAIGSGKSVYVHCLGGIGRTGTVVGCYLIRHGMADNENVFDKIRDLRINDPNVYRDSPETTSQRTFVLDWHKHEDRNHG